MLDLHSIAEKDIRASWSKGERPLGRRMESAGALVSLWEGNRADAGEAIVDWSRRNLGSIRKIVDAEHRLELVVGLFVSPEASASFVARPALHEILSRHRMDNRVPYHPSGEDNDED